MIKLGVQPWIKHKFRAIVIGFADYQTKFDSTKLSSAIDWNY